MIQCSAWGLLHEFADVESQKVQLADTLVEDTDVIVVDLREGGIASSGPGVVEGVKSLWPAQSLVQAQFDCEVGASAGRIRVAEE